MRNCQEEGRKTCTSNYYLLYFYHNAVHVCTAHRTACVYKQNSQIGMSTCQAGGRRTWACTHYSFYFFHKAVGVFTACKIACVYRLNTTYCVTGTEIRHLNIIFCYDILYDTNALIILLRRYFILLSVVESLFSFAKKTKKSCRVMQYGSCSYLMKSVEGPGFCLHRSIWQFYS